jgi:hypothetical protein
MLPAAAKGYLSFPRAVAYPSLRVEKKGGEKKKKES